MKRLILPTALAVVLSGAMAFAQTPAPAQDAPLPALAPHVHPHNPQKEVARLAKQLNLTPDQQSKLEPIFADHDQKLTALNADTTATAKDMKKQRHALEHDLRTQLATVLTPDQVEQMKAMHQGHKGNGAAPMPPPPAAPQA
jgi:Spy/CpxP family protein refolding chaperone